MDSLTSNISEIFNGLTLVFPDGFMLWELEGEKSPEFCLSLGIISLIHRIQRQRTELTHTSINNILPTLGPFFIFFVGYLTHACIYIPSLPLLLPSSILICLMFYFVYGHPCWFTAFLNTLSCTMWCFICVHTMMITTLMHFKFVYIFVYSRLIDFLPFALRLWF